MILILFVDHKRKSKGRGGWEQRPKTLMKERKNKNKCV